MGGTCSTYGDEYRVLVGRSEERYCFEKLGLCGEILLKWIFKKWDGGYGLYWSGSGKGQITCAFEWGNKHSGFIKSAKYPG
jgi:hypothetical protein